MKKQCKYEKMTFQERSFKRGEIIALSLILLLFISLCGIKFIKHEKSQQIRISSLEQKVSLLQKEINKSVVDWNPDNYNYLAIGNSITIHPINEYWLNESGMAATTVENDYVHLVASNLGASLHAFNFSTWEMTGYDRGETLFLLDGLLSEELDLITIQLSENASDLSTFQSDFEELIKYIQKSAPNAQLLVIGDFWDIEQKDKMKQQACEDTRVRFISLNEIKGVDQYQCGINTTVFDSNGKPYIVEHSGVAIHPGDLGMRWIADRIIEAVKE